MLEAFRKAMASRSAREAALTATRLGDVYLESDSYSDALGYYAQAADEELGSTLTDAELGRLYARIARCHLGLGDCKEARAYCDDANELELDDEDRSVAAEIDVVRARVEIESGRFEEALSAAQRAYDVLKTCPDSPQLAEAGKALGIANAELGNMTAARDFFTDYLVSQKRLGDEAGLAAAYNNLGVLAKRAGDLNAALEHFDDALTIDRKLGRSAAVADRLTNLGIVLHRLSRWAEAEERLNEARDTYRRLGAVRGLVAAESALGNVYRSRREWGKAREIFEQGLATCRENGYQRAEALALEFLGALDLDQGKPESALATLDRALAAAYRVSSASDVVGEVLRRRSEALFAMGRLDEAERDCNDTLRLTRSAGDRFEEGAALRNMAAIYYARGERAAAEAFLCQAEETLRRTGESFELARAALAGAVGLRESSGRDVPIDRIEARLSSAEAVFTRIGAGDWVARCEFERGKSLKAGGEPDRARTWLERARMRFEVAHDEHGLAEVDAAVGELDAELAGASVAGQGRYTAIAEGYRFLEMSEPGADDLYRFAGRIAEVLSVTRLVLFSLAESGPAVAASVDRSGKGVSEVSKFVRDTIEVRGHTSPLVLSEGRLRDVSAPAGAGAIALIPVRTGPARERVFLLYAERERAEDRQASFTQDDVEFLGAAARMLGLAFSRAVESKTWKSDGELAQHLGESPGFSGMITRSAEMLRILGDVERLKESRVPVLVRGESGTGKELIARAMHEGGRSRTGHFVALNAGAIAPHLQESELFGHVKGAFTDADRDREGLVQAAAGGTLFLDEIGEMSPQLQVKLLRFLQNGEYRRVGESLTRTSDARVVSASNKDLTEAMRTGGFRRDLYYRLCAVIVEVPPLRDRPEDIPLLMQHFLELYSAKEQKRIPGFSREARELLLKHDWRDNNVRELENEVRRGVALCADGESIGLDKLRPELRERYRAGEEGDGAAQRSLKDEVETLEKTRILEALSRSAWNKQRAAELLGMSRTGLHAKMRKYGIG
jgi:transcriptional regulator with PAS, ATPase and Fis domain/tetratricopeptide (TPR) repeat protein